MTAELLRGTSENAGSFITEAGLLMQLTLGLHGAALWWWIQWVRETYVTVKELC